MKSTMTICARDGSECWNNKHNKYHRLGDLPAIIHRCGTKEYWVNGRGHRIGGPAVEWDDGGYSWYIRGKLCKSFKEYQKKTKLSDNEITILILKYGDIVDRTY
jgi:hypothetical protein